VFAFPSTYEGFGLPLLEAMACGCPVVANRLTAIPEVVGEAGLLVDEATPEAFADGILRILGNPVLAQSLREMGIARARQFTWEQCAEHTAHVYREVAWRGWVDE
jgi:glycosyltransferase involved in cell wall biosynthesis